MRLIACARCHTQYDVSDLVAETFPCHCGETLANRPLKAVDARVHRCASCGAVVREEAESCAYCGARIAREPGRHSLICPECLARTPEDARFCTACGVAFRPEPIRIDGHELPCPACSVPMPPRAIGGVPVNECLTCHGLWIAGGNFERLVARALESRREASAGASGPVAPRVAGGNPLSNRVQYRKCPECDAFMQRRNFRRSSGVILDCCREHGTWLDADELEQIVGFILNGRGASPLPEPLPEPGAARATAEFERLRALYGARESAAGGRSRSIFVEVLTELLD